MKKKKKHNNGLCKCWSVGNEYKLQIVITQIMNIRILYAIGINDLNVT